MLCFWRALGRSFVVWERRLEVLELTRMIKLQASSKSGYRENRENCENWRDFESFWRFYSKGVRVVRMRGVSRDWPLQPPLPTFVSVAALPSPRRDGDSCSVFVFMLLAAWKSSLVSVLELEQPVWSKPSTIIECTLDGLLANFHGVPEIYLFRCPCALSMFQNQHTNLAVLSSSENGHVVQLRCTPDWLHGESSWAHI